MTAEQALWLRSEMITVYGEPQPAGSKHAFAVRKAGQLTGKIAVADAGTPASKARHKSWKAEVIDAAMSAVGACRPPMTGPIAVRVTFTVRRPKGHFGTGRNAGRLRDSAPAYPAVKPDGGKYQRLIEDALTTAGVWSDDAQVVDWHGAKRYPLTQWAGTGTAIVELPDPTILCGVPGADVLTRPGVVIRVWQLT